MNKSVRVIQEIRRATKLVTAVAALSICTTGFAHDEVSPFTMAVIKDDAYGRLVVSGGYSAAIAKINSQGRRSSLDFTEANNLCVAYTKSSMIDEAAEACEAALSIRRENMKAARDHEKRAYRNLEAMALSNRGVLLAVSGDTTGARRDFVAALELRAYLSAPATNLARLDVLVEKPVAMSQADR
jgi:hypothetical protein